MTEILDVSIGPVQQFVAQSRRTGDLWGSSYLLAYLSAHAIKAALDRNGKIIKPVVKGDRLYDWVCGEREGEPPAIGSVPNHFTVKVEAPAAEVAEACIRAVNGAWRRICNAVWQRAFAPEVMAGWDGPAIWRRQVETFWDISWVAGEAGTDPAELAEKRSRRKQWAARLLAPEQGTKCTMMYDYQELSGLVRATKKEERKAQDVFWERVRERLPRGTLRPDERLCAIAAVKRLFPLVAEKAVGWRLDPNKYPSTVDLALKPWLARINQTAPEEALVFRKHIREASADQALRVGRKATTGVLEDLDPNYLYEDSLQDAELCPLKDQATIGEDADKKRRQYWAEQLNRLQATPGPSGIAAGTPPNAYAILLADGDQLGTLAARLSAKEIGTALQKFTQGVEETVANHGGQAIYAGGDDVLAMLPVPKALACAAALAEAYRAAFSAVCNKEGVDLKINPTLSAAVVFAHLRQPITMALDEAHRCLDDVAKNRNGRNSLAVSVAKRGGTRALWVSTWQRLRADGSCEGAVALIQELAVALGAADGQTDRRGELSTSLVYRLRQTLTVLCAGATWHPGDWVDLPEGTDLHGFLYAEIVRGFTIRGEDVDQNSAGYLTDLIVRCLAPAPAQTETAAPQKVGLDGLMTACFLAFPEFQEVAP
ncbi:type III-B CRISPR-associated protein Cas10/Cmr2 [Acanthopleuribacter pedis]|uniref:Type III-B CRISPR-associated protein Cas10/Cmr2 n=1 Tax=Acanthopleuribacter pedis TaxID=442870 RepID=A0A8J7Q798_9BACT|nr:type III-B CRISPR-associated protein Cas10/Cmr2 [Acanthopleuribacter pedis]MBO1318079.1 type III-B CRISPR-associated protein Cas10/Cmr2 [Acanthopleuribacter pedis]